MLKPPPPPALFPRARPACPPLRRTAASTLHCVRVLYALADDERHRAIRQLSDPELWDSLAAAKCVRQAAWLDAFLRRARACPKIAVARAALNPEQRATAGRDLC